MISLEKEIKDYHSMTINVYDYALVAERVLLKRGTETGTEWKTENEMRVSKEKKYMNFVDTAAFEEKRFEVKQNL